MDATWRLRVVEEQLRLMTYSRRMIERALRDCRRSMIFDYILAAFYWLLGFWYVIMVGIGVNDGWYLLTAASWGALGGLFFWLGRRQIPIRARALESQQEIEEEMDQIILEHTRLIEEAKKEDNDA